MTLDVGAELTPVVKEITQEKINRYAQAGGDGNPLHTDPEFAARTMFGGTIAHGMLLLAYLSEMLTAAFGLTWLSGGRMKVRFRGAARPGDTVTVGGRVERTHEVDGGLRVVCAIACRSSPSPNRASNPPGRSPASSTGTSAPRATRQKRLAANASDHQRRPRRTVRGLTAKRSRSASRRRSVSPCANALTSTTTAPRYTRRPRNRTDAGVVRRRQPSRAQQKLTRYGSLSPSTARATPRGLRGYRALCSGAPHNGHPDARACAPRSSSNSSSKRQNLASAK